MARPGSSTALDIEYPCSDGQPMAESDFQLIPLLYAVAALRLHFQHRSDVYVAGNLFIYYEEGNPLAAVAPDVFVVLGAPAHNRFTYRLWQEPKGTDWVMEVTSRTTRREAQGRKRRLYTPPWGAGILAIRSDRRLSHAGSARLSVARGAV